jgi:geranylgeranyl diphosphate synthase type II
LSNPVSSDAPFEARVSEYRRRVENIINTFLAERAGEDTLGEAIKYAGATEGKRIRPLLSYATAEMLGVDLKVADVPATAIEMLHTYSLVHDDLPAMDDDDLRRGRPTVHKQFDEATGILVGDALLTFAFEWLATADVEPALVKTWVRQLAKAGGGQGMIQGQATDLVGESVQLSLSVLERMHRQKSGALIEASMTMIAAAAGYAKNSDIIDGSKNARSIATTGPTTSVRNPGEALATFGHHIGLAFQIRDDMLDVEGSTEALGKPQGSDESNNKSTFVTLLGLEGARVKLNEEQRAAEAALQSFGHEAEGLKWLSNYIVARDY